MKAVLLKTISEIELFTRGKDGFLVEKNFGTHCHRRKTQRSVVSHSVFDNGWICLIIGDAIVDVETMKPVPNNRSSVHTTFRMMEPTL